MSQAINLLKMALNNPPIKASFFKHGVVLEFSSTPRYCPKNMHCLLPTSENSNQQPLLACHYVSYPDR